jgi:sugar O-acyltransferase (sialic acid O-acetyltransferase NeuD family)
MQRGLWYNPNMSAAIPVTIPLINPNENEARLVALHIRAGQKIRAGGLLATLETTKSTFELTAEKAGFIAGISAKPGDLLRAGDLLCYLAGSKDWKAPKTSKKTMQPGIPAGLRITQPALMLAQKEKLDLTSLPIGSIVTEQHIRKILNQSAAKPKITVPQVAGEHNAIIVYGGGGHGKAVIELLRAVGAHPIVGLIDDGREPGDRVLDVPVLGGEGALASVLEAGCLQAVNAVGGIGAMSSRIAVFEKLRAAGFDFPTLLHPSGVVEPSAKLAAGVQVFPQTYIGSESKVGFGCIANTGTIVSHDCVLADYVNLAPGAILAGAVEIGEGTLVGMGVTVNLNVHIGAGSRIGNGATVKEDVPAGGIVRAGAVWPS